MTVRAVVRGLAWSASIWRRARTSEATVSASASRALARPACPRPLAARMSWLATTSPVESLRSSANARSTSSVVPVLFHSRDTISPTSSSIGAGTDCSDLMSAERSDWPAVSLPDSDRVHSSSASSFSMLAAAGGGESSSGMPMMAAGTSTIAITQPVTSATSRPVTAPATMSVRVRGLSWSMRLPQPPERGDGARGPGRLGWCRPQGVDHADQAGDDQSAADRGHERGHVVATSRRRPWPRSCRPRGRSRGGPARGRGGCPACRSRRPVPSRLGAKTGAVA